MQKITVIIVAYNSSRNIRDLIKSLQYSTKYVTNIIVIVNDSLDKVKTEKIIAHESTKSQIPIKLLKHSNEGFGTSCNYATKHVRTSHILFLNPDTIPKNDAINILFEHHLHNHSSISGANLQNKDGKIETSISRFPNIYFGIFHLSNIGKIMHYESAKRKFLYQDIDSRKLYLRDSRVETVSGACMLISKSTFLQLNGFDENFFLYLEDVDLCYQAKKRGMNISFCPHAVVTHVGGASSNNKYRINQQAWFNSRKYYYKKNTNLMTNIIMLPLFVLEEIVLKIRSLLQ